MTKFIDCSNGAKEEKKETVFTHCLHGEDGWIETNDSPKEHEKVKYLGKCPHDGDMFACYKENYIDIFKGIKGSEFDN